MSAPTVACVMLANGRPDMVKRAIKSFRAQTYERKWLLICETSGEFIEELLMLGQKSGGQVLYACASHLKGSSIGKLRNAANASASKIADIICHWDSDDWSHPNRIAEQVALLQSSSAECVGYDEMLFWDTTPGQFSGAWLYRAAGCMHIKNYAIGTSMCYWRKTWEKWPFPDRSPGCDDLYWSNGDTRTGMSVKIVCGGGWDYGNGTSPEPMMIAAIHGGNTCAKIESETKGGKEVWSRRPEWDGYCREAMKL